MTVSALAEKEKTARPMTVQVIKTKAEQALAEQFAAVESRLPGNAAVQKLRRAAIAAFASLGLPHRRIEEWKYTDLRNLMKEAPPLATGGYAAATYHFVEDTLFRSLKGADEGGDWSMFADGQLNTHNGELAGMARSLATVLQSPPAWVDIELARAAERCSGGVFALNTAFMTDGAVIDVPDGADWTAPVHVMFAAGFAKGENAADPRRIVTRNIVRVGRNAKLTLVENHQSDAALPRHANTVTQIVLGDGAEVTHVRHVETTGTEMHLGTTLVRLGAGASYRPFHMGVGTGLVRHDVEITFEGQHGVFDLGGVALARGSGHIDTTLVVDHAVPHCTSRELYKAVLDDHARGIFQGKVIVRPHAQKTDGKQMAQALMLSPDAEFDSKPELEIYADDVVCGHGSTAAEIDEDLLFYCMSRGIPKAEARALLIESFIGEAIEKVAHVGLRAALMARATQWLHRTSA